MQATKAFALLLAVLLGIAVDASAAEQRRNAFTVYGGYRGGGNFTDATSGSSLPLDGAGSWAASFELGLDAGSQMQVFVSRQDTHVDTQGATQVTATPLPAKFRLVVTYVHIGGTLYLDKKIGEGLYALGGIGATLFEPDLEGSSNTVRASLSLGFGYQWPISSRLGLRFEARGYATLVDSNSALFCSGGCAVSIKGNTLSQGEVLLGLAYRF